MTRNLKSLALLVGALLAIGGLMAQAASAHTPARFTLEQSTTTLTGQDEGNSLFSITGQDFSCDDVAYHSHVVGTDVERVTLKPTYTGCIAFGFANAKVTGFGHYGEAKTCDYEVWADGTADLECDPETDITVHVSSICIVHIPEQTDLGAITYTTENKVVVGTVKHDMTWHVHLDNITATHTDLSFLCPFAGSGEISNATLDARITVWGEDPAGGALVDFTWDSTAA